MALENVGLFKSLMHEIMLGKQTLPEKKKNIEGPQIFNTKSQNYPLKLLAYFDPWTNNWLWCDLEC